MAKQKNEEKEGWGILTAELQHKRQKRRKKLTEKDQMKWCNRSAEQKNSGRCELCLYEGLVSNRGPYLCGTAQVIIVNLLNSLEVDDTLQFALMFICKQKKRRRHAAKNRSLNKNIIAKFLFLISKQDKLTPKAKANKICSPKTSISKYFYWKTRQNH